MYQVRSKNYTSLALRWRTWRTDSGNLWFKNVKQNCHHIHLSVNGIGPSYPATCVHMYMDSGCTSIHTESRDWSAVSVNHRELFVRTQHSVSSCRIRYNPYHFYFELVIAVNVSMPNHTSTHLHTCLLGIF